jgi:molybdopterin/thiamine biosynthesis adenylyltransferase
MARKVTLAPEERAIYEWQMWVPGFGEEGQEKLKGASVLISRCGGLGGVVALELAAAGIGRLILAHGGSAKPSDFNRQILLTHDALGRPRLDGFMRRLKEFNPRLEIMGVPENVKAANVERLVREADLVVDCAPLFEERFLLNREAVRQGKPMVECAMYELEGRVTTILPGRTPCLQCLYPQAPHWKRQFPVFGAVAGTAGCLGALEAIKVLSGLGTPLAGRMLIYDLREVSFRVVQVERDPACAVCATPGTARAT